MTLRDWLVQQEITVTEFAERIGKSQAAVHRYVHRKRIPEPEIMALIVSATEGAVTPNDFYDLHTARRIESAGAGS